METQELLVERVNKVLVPLGRIPHTGINGMGGALLGMDIHSYRQSHFSLPPYGHRDSKEVTGV
jgi:hypothetical protein